MTKKNKPLSFKELGKMRKKIAITYAGEKLCELEELSAENLSHFMKMILEVDEINVDENNQTTFNVDNHAIAFLFRTMVKGLDIEDLTDEEIIETVKNMGAELEQQFSSAIKELVLDKSEHYLETLASSLNKQDEKLKVLAN